MTQKLISFKAAVDGAPVMLSAYPDRIQWAPRQARGAKAGAAGPAPEPGAAAEKAGDGTQADQARAARRVNIKDVKVVNRHRRGLIALRTRVTITMRDGSEVHVDAMHDEASVLQEIILELLGMPGQQGNVYGLPLGPNQRILSDDILRQRNGD
ncbi:MAG: hypothetical protein LBM66_05320 [Bifidobacteriaceae bacterium]|jgi:hypothetical protein|nr:hypothetical protein [Bifidobacteriaceae bacterium]